MSLLQSGRPRVSEGRPSSGLLRGDAESAKVIRRVAFGKSIVKRHDHTQNGKMGDLVFFSSQGQIPDRVDVHIGSHQFLHAEKMAGQISIASLNQPWYANRFLGARRVVDFLTDGERCNRDVKQCVEL